MKKLLIILTFAYSALSLSYFEVKDLHRFKEECQNNIKFTSPNYEIDCGRNFHHYNSKARVRPSNRRQTVKISHFNALHPGMSKTRFKDYHLVAKMLSQFDIIAVTELIPSMSNHLQTNRKVADFAKEMPLEIKRHEDIVKKLEIEQSYRHSIVRDRELHLQRMIIKNIKKDLNRLNDVYKAPGYLRILNELRALNDGNNWSLILSSSPEGRESNSTKELVGFYYRANLVAPVKNKYCANRNLTNGSQAYACHPLFDRKDLGQDKSFIMSRRPFMASFKAGKFETTLLAAHSIFDSPNLGTPWMEKVLMAAFGEKSSEDLPLGINRGNFARYSELKVTLEFIQRQLSRSREDIVLLGDFNLESKNLFMDEVVKTWQGAKIFIDKKTSVLDYRYQEHRGRKIPTYGVASNYDHFFLDPIKTKECMSSPNTLNGDVFNFLNLPASEDFIGKKYKVRIDNNNGRGPYRIDRNKYNRLIRDFVDPMRLGTKPILTIGRKKFTYQGKYSRTSLAIIPDDREMQEQSVHFISRVLESQKVDESYYYFYVQVISDHLPIYMTCEIN